MEYDPKTVPKLSRRASMRYKFKKIVQRVTSTPVGQYSLYKIDSVLYIFEKSLEWSVPFRRININGSIVEKQEDKENGSIFPRLPPHLVRPLPWIIFIPFLLALRLARLYLNIFLTILRFESVQYEDTIRFIQDRRREIRELRFSGSRNIRSQQRLVAERFKNREIQMNILCRIFSRWPLSIVASRIRKILNFLGIITLPQHNSLHRVPSAAKDLPPGSKRKHNEVEQYEGKNDLNKVVTAATKLLNNDKENENLDSDSDYEPSEESGASSTSSEDTQLLEKEVKARRVSVTVQEIIPEETEEESINISEDTIKSYDKKDSLDTFYSPFNSNSVSPEPAHVEPVSGQRKKPTS